MSEFSVGVNDAALLSSNVKDVRDEIKRLFSGYAGDIVASSFQGLVFCPTVVVKREGRPRKVISNSCVSRMLPDHEEHECAVCDQEEKSDAVKRMGCIKNGDVVVEQGPVLDLIEECEFFRNRFINDLRDSDGYYTIPIIISRYCRFTVWQSFQIERVIECLEAVTRYTPFYYPYRELYDHGMLTVDKDSKRTSLVYESKHDNCVPLVVCNSTRYSDVLVWIICFAKYEIDYSHVIHDTAYSSGGITRPGKKTYAVVKRCKPIFSAYLVYHVLKVLFIGC